MSRRAQEIAEALLQAPGRLGLTSSALGRAVWGRLALAPLPGGLGIQDAATLVDRIRSRGVDAVVSQGHDQLDPRYLGGPEALESLDSVIVLDSHVSALERVAHVLLPARVAAEKYATFTNAAGRVQRVTPAVEPDFDAYPEGELLARLGVALGFEGWRGDWEARGVSRSLAASNPRFAGCDWEGVGSTGRALGEPKA